jgi:hypothetical protein
MPMVEMVVAMATASCLGRAEGAPLAAAVAVHLGGVQTAPSMGACLQSRDAAHSRIAHCRHGLPLGPLTDDGIHFRWILCDG